MPATEIVNLRRRLQVVLTVLEPQHAFDEVFLYRGKGVTEVLQAACLLGVF